MEKKLHLGIPVLLGNFQPSVNFLTRPSSLGWGADKHAGAYQVKRLQFNSTASCAISGWTEYVLVWNVVKVTIKKAKYQNIVSFVCTVRSFPSPHLLERETFDSWGTFFQEIQHAAYDSPQMLWGNFSFGMSCNLQDLCWERKSLATAHKHEPWGAGEVKEGQMGWHSFMVPGVLPTVVWSNCSLHQFCHSCVVDFIPYGM